MSLTPRSDRMDKNYFINGGMDYSQIYALTAKAITSSTPTYVLDQWRVSQIGNWTADPNIEKQANTIAGEPKITFASRSASGQATDATAELVYDQPIESIFAQDLSNKAISLNFSYWESEFQEVDIKFYYANVKDDFSAITLFKTINKTITNDSTWRTVEIPNEVMDTNSKNGIMVQFVFKNPENFAVAIESKFTRVKLNLGEKTQEFSLARRDIAEELSLCQRYFEKSYNPNNAPGVGSSSGELVATASGTDIDNAVAITVQFKVDKRAVPLFIIFNPVTGGSGSIRNITGSTNITADSSSVGTSSAKIKNSAAATDLRLYSAHFTANAQLT